MIAFEFIYICILQSGGKVATAVSIAISSVLVEEIQFTATAAWKVDRTIIVISHQAHSALIAGEPIFITKLSV